MQLNAFGHMALASWDTSNQNVVINLGNWLLALNISKPIKHHSFCIIILQLFYIFMNIISYYYKKCWRLDSNLQQNSIHLKKLLKLTHRRQVQMNWWFLWPPFNSLCSDPQWTCHWCHWCHWTNPPLQRPSGAHLLLLVDDVETWNSKLKEMEGGSKKT